MEQQLGILVRSDQCFSQLLALCRAAKNRNINTKVFFTHKGARLIQAPHFQKMKTLATMAVCKVSLQRQGIDTVSPDFHGVALATQAWHAELIRESHRYVVF
jgi:hypothetical protein